MDSSRTTASGQGLTLITGVGGRPIDRDEVEAWCRSRECGEPQQRAAQPAARRDLIAV